MSNHLSPEEFVDAIDGVLTASRQSHLDGCEACRGEVAALGGLARQVDVAAEVPEPSPLYWDHLSRRISEATANDAASAPAWWQLSWRPLVAGGAMVVAAALVVMLRAPGPAVTVQAPVGDGSVTTVAASDLAAGSADDRDVAWDLVVAMAAELSVDDVHEVMTSAGPETAVLPETMTARERQEFVKLLKQEMGGLE
jgi:hypothetical protein